MPPGEAAEISVPGHMSQKEGYDCFAYSSVFPGYHGYVWFYRTFVPERLPQEGERVLLEFDEAGYVTEVFLNGVFLGRQCIHERAFSYDITDALRANENLVAVRCFEPAPRHEAIDGIDLDHIPNAKLAHATYNFDSSGGIENEVRYRIVRTVRVDDVYVRSVAKTGEVDVAITLYNAASQTRRIALALSCTENKTGLPVAATESGVDVPPGQSIRHLHVQIPGHRRWDIDCPVLYQCQVLLDGELHRTRRFGFKELCLKNGFFFLNGRRIFLKCAHASCRGEAMIGMKNTGFNAVRFLTHVADPEVLDLCDEIGLLVIESPRSSWGMTDHAQTGEMILSSMESMILRDRSHPCIAAWYVFNELQAEGGEIREKNDHDPYDVQTFFAGVNALPYLRQLDIDHLILLGSGRWDGYRMIGSAANPGSSTWEYHWGAEGDEQYTPKPWHENYTNSFLDVDGCGDLHPYARMPLDADTRNWFRTLAYDTRPVFLSETGNGSQADPVRRKLESEAAGMLPDSLKMQEYTRLCDGLEQFFEQNGFADLFPFPQSFCEETYRMNARQREQMFDVIRANPMICGYSLTSWCQENEGTLEGDQILKPGQSYALQTGWAPLRWALFPEERTVYADRPIRLEAVLCNEDVLSPGAYRAEARIHAAGRGVVWKYPFTAVYPADGYGGMPPLAARVMDETTTLSPGEYTLTLKLLEGNAPYGGTARIRSVAVDGSRASGKKIVSFALATGTISFLHQYGVETVDVREAATDEPQLLLVGDLRGLSGEDEHLWKKALAMAEAGSRVLFLRAEHFRGERYHEMEQPIPHLQEIAGENARCMHFYNWLYHMDTIHIDHPVFANTTPAGILDMETWGDCCPESLFLRVKQPDTVLAAGIGLNCQIENQCACSQALCEYRRGRGKIILNGFRIEETLTQHPFADQLLLNLVAEYADA